jgi:hypothetical protein
MHPMVHEEAGAGDRQSRDLRVLECVLECVRKHVRTT